MRQVGALSLRAVRWHPERVTFRANGNGDRLPPGGRPPQWTDAVNSAGLSRRQIALLNALADEMRGLPDDPDVLTPSGAALARQAEDVLRAAAEPGNDEGAPQPEG